MSECGFNYYPSVELWSCFLCNQVCSGCNGPEIYNRIANNDDFFNILGSCMVNKCSMDEYLTEKNECKSIV